MSPDRAVPAADDPRGTAAPSPGGAPVSETSWAPPALDLLLRRQRRWQELDRRHPWLLDTVVVLVVTLMSLPDLLTGGTRGPLGDVGNHSLPRGVDIAFTAALIIPLWWRRKTPATVFAVLTLVSFIQWSLGVWETAGLSVLVALYSLALHGSLRALRWAFALAVGEVVVAVLFLVPVQQPLLGLFFLIGTITAAAATGLTLRIRRMYLAALEDRTRRLEIERDQRAQLTAAAERARVAREMHDIIGHNLTVMIGLADGAATLAAHRGETSEQALRLLGDTGRQAMGELRRVLGVLREEPGGERLLSPQPAIRDLDPLLTRVRAAGATVSYRTSGDLDHLGSGVQLAVYRIVQEALTNALKHAGTGTSAEVTVATDGTSIHVRVADTGPPPDAAPHPAGTERDEGSGHGLVGIRQRAALYGGTATIGPRPDRPGWLVDVCLDANATIEEKQDRR